VETAGCLVLVAVAGVNFFSRHHLLRQPRATKKKKKKKKIYLPKRLVARNTQ